MANRDPYRLSLRARFYLRTREYRRYKYESFGEYMERMFKRLPCRFFGHVDEQRFSCVICKRCRIVLRNR